MQLPKNATVAVTDGQKFNLFQNAGDESGVKLTALAHDTVDANHEGATPAATAVRLIPTADRTRKTVSRPASSTS